MLKSILKISLVTFSCNFTLGYAATPCTLVDFHNQQPLMAGTLSPFWAQEYVGADLARQALGKEPHEVRVAILDVAFDPDYLTGRITDEAKNGDYKRAENAHGTAVSNLLNGVAPIGVGSSAVIASLATRQTPRWWDHVVKSVRQSHSQILNVSLDMYRSQLVRQALQEIAKTTLVVISAGNDYPISLFPNNALESNIVVGNMSVTGLISAGTREGSEVTIMAPSDHSIQTIEGEGGITSFSGTSAAAPVVAGALSNVLSILDDLKWPEAKILLERTAIRTLNFDQAPMLNGSGMVNAYKLAEVAKRLKRLGWPQQRDELLRKEEAFDFSSEAEANLEMGQDLLAHTSCTERQKGFDMIRAAFLLNQGDLARTLLAATYSSIGLTTNAQFYLNLDHDRLLAFLKQKLSAQDPHAELNSSFELFKSLAVVGEAAVPIILSAWHGNDSVARTRAAVAAEYIGRNPQLLEVVRAAARDADPELRNEIAYHAWRLGPLAPEILKKSLEDSDPSVRKSASVSANLLGETGTPILEYIFANDNDDVKTAALTYSYFLNGRAVSKALSLGLRSSSSSLRQVAAMSLNYAGNEGITLAALAAQDGDPLVRIAALSGLAGLITDGVGGYEILSSMLSDTDESVRRSIVKKIVSIWKDGFSLKPLGKAGVTFLRAYLDDSSVDQATRDQLSAIISDIQNPAP